MDHPGCQAAKKVECQKPHWTHAVFNVVAEDPKRPHVSDNVDPAAMEEHARHEWPVIVKGQPYPDCPLRMRVTRRHDAEIVEEHLQHRLGQHELEDKDDAVGRHYEPHGDRNVSGGNRVANWNHGFEKIRFMYVTRSQSGVMSRGSYDMCSFSHELAAQVLFVLELLVLNDSVLSPHYSELAMSTGE